MKLNFENGYEVKPYLVFFYLRFCRDRHEEDGDDGDWGSGAARSKRGSEIGKTNYS